MSVIGQGGGGKCHMKMLCHKLMRNNASVVTYSLGIQFPLVFYLVKY